MSLPLISINGVTGASISPLDRGFAYGDGVFETCRCFRGRIPLWRFHRERLLASAERLKIPVDHQRLKRYLAIALQQAQLPQDAVIKIQITRGVGGRGYRIAENLEPTYVVGIFAGTALHTGGFVEGVEVRVCDLRLGKNPALAGMKHLNRLEHILARAEWQDEFDEGLLLDCDGNLVEATVSNLFVVREGKLFTPDLSSAGVAGVMRRVVIEQLAPQINVPVELTQLTLDSLVTVEEVFLTNSVFGIWPVKTIAGVSRSFSHAFTRQLQGELSKFIANSDDQVPDRP